MIEFKRINGTYSEIELPIKEFNFCICDLIILDGGLETKKIRSTFIINKKMCTSKEIFNFSQLSYIKINYDNLTNKISGDDGDLLKDIDILFIR